MVAVEAKLCFWDDQIRCGTVPIVTKLRRLGIPTSINRSEQQQF